jgi:twinkle protein
MSILNRFELAARRFDCKVFMVDNLMTADYGKTTDTDFYRQQSRFVGQLVAFANKHNVHVHLVAHPRKTGGKALENDDVSGSGDITNRAANVIAVKRNVDGLVGLSVEIKKNRWEGNCGSVGLNYCNISHRVFTPAVGNNARYGWEDQVEEGFTEYDINSDMLPF